MITAVDTNLLVDILIDSPRQPISRQLLREARERGYLLVAPVVYAELGALLSDRQQLGAFLKAAGINEISPFSEDDLLLAGKAWKEYNRRRPRRIVCPSCGAKQEVTCPKCKKNIETRQHILTDFLVGAHAMVHAGRLLSHDYGFIQKYFPDLKVLSI